MKSNKIFEIGKAYEHNAGMQMYICGMADSILYGTCFIAENGWNQEKLKIRQIEYDKRINNQNSDEIISAIRPGDEGRIETFSAISMINDVTMNWFEINKEDFIKNNYSR